MGFPRHPAGEGDSRESLVPLSQAVTEEKDALAIGGTLFQEEVHETAAVFAVPVNYEHQPRFRCRQVAEPGHLVRRTSQIAEAERERGRLWLQRHIISGGAPQQEDLEG